MVVAAIRADEGTHVLYHAKDWYIDFPKEIDPSHCVSNCQVLWGGDNNSALTESAMLLVYRLQSCTHLRARHFEQL